MVAQEQSLGVVVLEGRGQMLTEKKLFQFKIITNALNTRAFILNVRDKCAETSILPVGTTMGGGLGAIM